MVNTSFVHLIQNQWFHFIVKSYQFLEGKKAKYKIKENKWMIIQLNRKLTFLLKVRIITCQLCTAQWYHYPTWLFHWSSTIFCLTAALTPTWNLSVLLLTREAEERNGGAERLPGRLTGVTLYHPGPGLVWRMGKYCTSLAMLNCFTITKEFRRSQLRIFAITHH